MYAFSFTTNVGKFSLVGEYSFRPNLPLQIGVSDVLFAAVQPGLPDEDVDLRNINSALDGLGVGQGIPFPGGVITGRRNAAPDIVQTDFRNDPVAPNELIEGFERFEAHQVDFTALRVFGPNNPFFANQIILLTELGATYIPDLTDPLTLPIETLFLDGSHPSPGADGTGEPDGEPDPRRLNPTQQTDNFADDFSADYRILAMFQYSNGLFGLTYNPIVAFLHDVKGTAPFPIQNFVEDRKQVIVGTGVQFTQALVGNIQYQTFFGGNFNNLNDRDNASLSLTYSF